MLDSFDSDHLPPDEFPVLTRLHEIISAGHDLDDVIAGFASVKPRLDAELSAELQQLIDVKKLHDLAIEVCLACATAVAPTARFLFVANAAHCEHERQNYHRSLELARAALDLLESDEDSAPANLAWCCNQLAWTHYSLGEYAEGLPYAEKAIAHDPESWNAQGTLGSILHALDDERSFEHLELAMKNGIDPLPSPELAVDPRYRALAKQYDIALPKEN